MSSARYAKIPAKGIYLSNSPCFGFNLYLAHAGDLISYVENDSSNDPNYPRTMRMARVLDLVTHDHEGKEYRKATGRGKQTKRAPKLRVLAFDDLLTHAFERWIDIESVRACRTPNAASVRLAAWLLGGPLPKPETVLAASSYGSLSDHYFANACDENGNLGEDWRARSDAHHKRVQDANEAKRAERIANDQGSAADEVRAADEG